MPNNNIFRQAQALLQQKPISEMNEEELHIVNAATIPLTMLKMFNGKTTDEGLDELAKIVEDKDHAEEHPWAEGGSHGKLV